MVRKLPFLLVLAALVLVPSLVLAQAQTTGRINGTVKDENGEPMADVTVTATSIDLGLEQETTTGDDGRFVFVNLQVGNWMVTATALGMQPQVLTFRLAVGEVKPLNITLMPGEAISQEVTVYSTATALEVTTTGSNIDFGREVEELPIQNRLLYSAASFAPNMAFNPNNNLAISGAPGTDTVVLLDGAEISDPYFGGPPTLYLEDAIEEVQVMTSGVSARYGRFQGGVINAVTKTGTNQWEATLRGEFSNQSWNATTPFGEDQDDSTERVLQLTAGGYFWKDHLWFFGGIRDTPDSSTSSNTLFDGGSYSTVNAQERWQVKLRGAPNANHIFDISHLNYENEQSGRAALPAGDVKFANGVRADPRKTYTFAYQGVLSSSLFLDLQATQKEVSIASGGDPNRPSPVFTASPFAFWNNHWWDFTDPTVRDNETASGNVSYTFGSNVNHFMEGGVQYVNSITGGNNRQSATFRNLILYNSDAFVGFDGGNNALFQWRPGTAERWNASEAQVSAEIANVAIYVQDTISVGNWRFDVGLRWDQVDSSSNIEFQNFKYNVLSPRLAAAYNIDPTWQLLATYGTYLGRLNDNIFGEAVAVGSNPGINALWTCGNVGPITGEDVDIFLSNDACWGNVQSLSDPNQPTTFMTQDVQGPHGNDFTFGLRKALANNSGSVAFTYHNRQFDDLLEDHFGRVCSEQGICNFDNQQPGNGDYTTANIPAPTLFDSTVWDNSSQAERNYQAFSIVGEYRPGPRWSVFGNYTWSEITGNFEGEGQNTPAAGGNIGDYPSARPEEGAVPFGNMDEDITHRFSSGVIYNLDFGRAGNLALGGVLIVQSGAVWSRTAEVGYNCIAAYVNCGGTYTHYFDGRGRNRIGGFWRGDLSARYQIPLVSKLDLWVKVAAINVSNEGSPTSFNDTATGSTVAGNGVLTWVPNGNCPNEPVATLNCSNGTQRTGFGATQNEDDFQLPREWLFTIGLNW